jgi:biotin transport system ATP-binding protein
MISIENVCKSFKTSQGIIHALKNISLEISDNSCTVIAGENGSGKSVLMYIIAGLEKADSGELKVDGRVGLVFQEAETQILGETPREDITFGPKNLGWKKDKIELAVKNALEQTGLTNKADFPARFLSGGEKRRLAVACMLAMDLPVIIFDEPYANLDYSGVKQVNELIRQLKKNGKTIIILTHEIEKCLALADKFVVLFRGEKKFDGIPEKGLLQPLEEWNIRNPLVSYKSVEDLVW